MKRWNTREQQFEDSPARVERFLDELTLLYRKHGMALGHEDGHGAFIIHPLSDNLVQWVRDAHYNPPPDKQREFPFRLP